MRRLWLAGVCAAIVFATANLPSANAWGRAPKYRSAVIEWSWTDPTNGSVVRTRVDVSSQVSREYTKALEPPSGGYQFATVNSNYVPIRDVSVESDALAQVATLKFTMFDCAMTFRLVGTQIVGASQGLRTQRPTETQHVALDWGIYRDAKVVTASACGSLYEQLAPQSASVGVSNYDIWLTGGESPL